MRIFCTKYLFTLGITEHNAELVGGNDSMVRVIDGVPYGMYLHGEGRDWHKTKESAIARAEVIREKKIKALEKQLNKIKEMVF